MVDRMHLKGRLERMTGDNARLADQCRYWQYGILCFASDGGTSTKRLVVTARHRGSFDELGVWDRLLIS